MMTIHFVAYMSNISVTFHQCAFHHLLNGNPFFSGDRKNCYNICFDNMHRNILHYLHIAFHRLDMPIKFRKVQKYLDEVKIPTFKLKLMINDEAMTFPTANLIVFYVLWRNAWHGKFRYLSNAYNTQTISISSFDCFIIINASANTI